MFADDADNRSSKPCVTLVQFTWAFVPFALLISVALLYPEASQNLRLFRTIYLIRASLLLVLPALVFFPFIGFGVEVRNLWRLFWTFGLIAHLAHLGYAVFFVFGDQLETARLYPDLYGLSSNNVSVYRLIVEQQTSVVVWSNIAVTGFWLLDAALAWGSPPTSRAIWSFHVFTWLYVIFSFIVSTIYFYKNAASYNLGVCLIAVVTLALVVRALLRSPGSNHTQFAPVQTLR